MGGNHAHAGRSLTVSAQSSFNDRCIKLGSELSQKSTCTIKLSYIIQPPVLLFRQDRSGEKKENQGACAITTNVTQHVGTLLKITIELEMENISDHVYLMICQTLELL